MRVLCNNAFDCMYNSICYHRVIHTYNSAGDKSPCNCYCHRLNIAVKCAPVEQVIRKQKLKKINEKMSIDK